MCASWTVADQRQAREHLQHLDAGAAQKLLLSKLRKFARGTTFVATAAHELPGGHTFSTHGPLR